MVEEKKVAADEWDIKKKEEKRSLPSLKRKEMFRVWFFCGVGALFDQWPHRTG